MDSNENYVLFYKHNPTKPYCQFSQWYQGGSFTLSDESQLIYNVGIEIPTPVTFNTRETFMMYCKALLFNDTNRATIILNATDPAVVKSEGRKVRNFNIDEWNEYKYKFVVNGNYLQFSQNPQMKQVLLSTGEKMIVEASPYDAVWGIGKSAANAFDTNGNPVSGWGQNLLGKALVEVRTILRTI